MADSDLDYSGEMYCLGHALAEGSDRYSAIQDEIVGKNLPAGGCSDLDYFVIRIAWDISTSRTPSVTPPSRLMILV